MNPIAELFAQLLMQMQGPQPLGVQETKQDRLPMPLGNQATKTDRLPGPMNANLR